MNGAMSSKEYFEKIIDLYIKSRNCYFNSENIFRGRSKTISSELEELTAYYIMVNSNNTFKYFIDQPIKMDNSTRYPDIVIQQKDGTIKDLIDIKADTGWFRYGMFDFCKEWNCRMESVKSKCTKFKNGLNKEIIDGKFHDTLKYHVVIISLCNSGNQLKRDYNRINEMKNIELYILSSETHPNAYNIDKKGIIKQIKIHDCEFKRLLANLKR